MKANMKLRIARILNRLLPNRYCWAGLVVWALCDAPFDASPEDCIKDSIEDCNGCCYCGKFVDGKVWRQL